MPRISGYRSAALSRKQSYFEFCGWSRLVCVARFLSSGKTFIYYFQFELLVSSQLQTQAGFQSGCFLSSLLWGSYGFLSTGPCHFPELSLHCLLNTLLMSWARSPLCCFDFVETRFHLKLVQVGLSLAIRSLSVWSIATLGSWSQVPNLWNFHPYVKIGSLLTVIHPLRG